MIIAIQCTSTSFNEQLREKYPFSYERYMDKINGDIPMFALMGNYIICRINDGLEVLNMFAETKEDLSKCKVFVERYARKSNQEVSYDLDVVVENGEQVDKVKFGETKVTEIVTDEIAVAEKGEKQIQMENKEMIEAESGHTPSDVVQYRSCCVTGHRPKDLYGYDRKAYVGLKNVIIECLREMIEIGVTDFYNGMAQGADQLFFWAVEGLKKEYPNIKNICYRPFVNQEFKWKIKEAFGQDDYRKMTEYADDIIECNLEPVTTDQEAIISNMNRNTKMIKVSDIVLAITNNSVADIRNKAYKGKGGTADAIKKAIKANKTIWEINPVSLEVIK